MRLSILILSLALPAAAAAAPPARLGGPMAKCPYDRVILADRNGKAEGPRKLGELPPGQLYLSVDREVGGCRQPAIVRYKVGEAGRRRGR